MASLQVSLPETDERGTRIQTVDILRGLVIVIMALDHTRDFISISLQSPLDPTSTTPALYLTRWITNLCAPTFVFLCGRFCVASTREQGRYG